MDLSIIRAENSLREKKERKAKAATAFDKVLKEEMEKLDRDPFRLPPFLQKAKEKANECSSDQRV